MNINLKTKHLEIIQFVCLVLAFVMLLPGVPALDVRTRNELRKTEFDIDAGGSTETKPYGDSDFGKESILSADKYQDFPGIGYVCIALVSIGILLSAVFMAKKDFSSNSILNKWYTCILPLLTLILFIYAVLYLTNSPIVVDSKMLDEEWYSERHWAKLYLDTIVEYTAAMPTYIAGITLSLNFVLDVVKKIVLRNKRQSQIDRI